MIRARIVVSGRVQKAGYKDTVDEIAYYLGLKGYVKNLDDGTVEVVCEGEKKDIDELVKKIRVRDYPIFVEDVKVKYSEATGEFKQFDIIREKDITEATYERMDAAARYMRGMNKNLGEKIGNLGENLGEKIDSMHHDLKGEQRGMHQDMNTRFDWVAEKYGDIGAGINSIKDDLGELKNMGNDVKEMKNLFARLVNHIVKE